MNLFVAWVVVGFCCYLIERNNRYKHMGKYVLVDSLYLRMGESCTDEEKRIMHLMLETSLCLIYVVAAPFVLFTSVRRLFKPRDYDGLKARLLSKGKQ